MIHLNPQHKKGKLFEYVHYLRHKPIPVSPNQLLKSFWEQEPFVVKFPVSFSHCFTTFPKDNYILVHIMLDTVPNLMYI
jgi:hypothetical protein